MHRRIHRTIALSTFLLAIMSGNALAQCPEFSPASMRGTIDDVTLSELSGMVASPSQDGIFWGHNDSGHPARIYAFDHSGHVLGSFKLKGIKNRDFEDLAMGPGPDQGTSYLYVGDIGDNGAVRNEIYIYRFEEPDATLLSTPAKKKIKRIDILELTYPDGARDAESLLIDPIRGDVIVISKREDKSRLYSYSGWGGGSAHGVLTYRGELPWGWAVAADVAPDGSRIVVRGYFNASIWLRDIQKPLWDAVTDDNCPVPLAIEPQGEAICFSRDGHSYWTSSERETQPLYQYTPVTTAP